MDNGARLTRQPGNSIGGCSRVGLPLPVVGNSLGASEAQRDCNSLPKMSSVAVVDLTPQKLASESIKCERSERP